jgi:hypothetical protein
LEFVGSSVVHHISILDAGEGVILKLTSNKSGASDGPDFTDEPFNTDCGAL